MEPARPGPDPVSDALGERPRHAPIVTARLARVLPIRRHAPAVRPPPPRLGTPGRCYARVVCELVYLVIAGPPAPSVLEASARAHHLHCDRVDDRAIGKSLAGEQLYATFEKCSCGTALGARDDTPDPPWSERDVRELVRRGWGDAKIARWKAQREAARAAPPRDPNPSPSPEAERMAACLRALLDAGATRAGFIVHQAGNRTSRAALLPFARLDADTVQRVPFDTVQLFTR
ncbi:MAG TPA: hypothetical protein VHE35_10880 [Kofleriaceae bacterium]|nr:hypothetical protein [Kofleriaceae bacterium]